MSYNQRETPILAELCTHLVEDVYGELAARVYSILARHGRQTLAAVVRASYLSGRQIKYGLTILLQQHLVFHSGSVAPAAHYEIDWQNSYALVRFGKITKLVEDRFGRKAANVMSNLLTLGHTRIADLKEAYFPTDTESDYESDDGITNGAGTKRKRTNGAHVNGSAATTNGVVNGVPAPDEDTQPEPSSLTNGVNGINGDHKTNGANHAGSEEKEPGRTDDGEIASLDELYDIIERLMQRGWIRTVVDTQYLSPGDMHALVQSEVIDDFCGGVVPTGAKDKDRLNRAIIERKRALRDESLRVPKFTRRQGTDRDYGSSNKRIKINGTNGVQAAAPLKEDEIVVRANSEKISVAMRTEQLVHLVDQRLGPVTAHVYRTMLRMLEAKISRCYEEWPDPPMPSDEAGAENHVDPDLLVTAREVAKKLDRDPELDIFDGLDPNAIVQITRKGHVRSSNVLSQAQDPSRLNIDDKTRIIDKHMQLLAEDPMHFVTWYSRAGYSQWHVEFDTIAQALIQQEVENTISARKGSLGVKLIRALKKKGRLDERAACNVMMMSATDIRGIINDLTVQGFVQTQEIPKVERREAKHSLHLFWYDRQRAREKLLHDTYKGMVRIMQRIAFEREKVQPVLSKAERSDVIGNEDKWLSKSELNSLKEWKNIQERLLLQLFREDDLVAALRDFYGPLTTS